MIKFFAISLFSLLFFAPVQEKYSLLQKIETDGNFITSDPLGNCYLANNYRIFKYNKEGKLLTKYSNNNYGPISSIDATNPYKILSYYQDFGKLLFLDNMLSINGEAIDLIDSQFDQTSLVCLSHDNGFWLYDPLLNELFRLNEKLDINQQTGNLTRLLNQKIKPNYLIQYNNRLYLNNPSSGILVFDQYGTYLKTIPLRDLKTFQVKDDRIHFLKNNQLHTYFFKSLDTDTTLLPSKEKIKDIRVEKRRLFILTDQNLDIYQVN